MREILFRGFHECENGTQKAYYNGEWHTGKWACGDLITSSWYSNGETLIIQLGQRITVAPETVCQYTGLKDKNGKKIFKGDILKVLLSGEPAIGVIDYGKTGICAYCTMTEKTKSNYVLETDKSLIYEVIGNKFENPELLEVEK